MINKLKRMLIDLFTPTPQRVIALEGRVQELLVLVNAQEAEMRMLRIRLGWEIPGRYHPQGHWVWHANDGKQTPFPGVRWEHVLPSNALRTKDYRD